MHVLFCSRVFFIGLPWDSTRTIKGLVKVLCLIPSCIANLEYFNSSVPLEALLLFLINMHGLTAFFFFAFGLSLTATSPSSDFNANFHIFDCIPARAGGVGS